MTYVCKTSSLEIMAVKAKINRLDALQVERFRKRLLGDLAVCGGLLRFEARILDAITIRRKVAQSR